ncbi:MAG: hypothetical protein IKC35_01160 [Clostridia bacterium]|nr:hypothetical protein [Clostridia bacterium]
MKYLCFDIESCDGGKNGSLCSFGYCLADENFNIIEQDDILVNPNKPFNKRLFGSVIKLAYTEDVFRAAPKFPLVFDRIKALFDNQVTIIGFSIINDVNYVADAIRTYKLKQLEYEFFDVQLMYGIYKKESRNYSLAAAAEEFDIEFLEHRSMDDAVATLNVLKGILSHEGKTFDEFVGEYSIMPVRINAAGIKNCFTDVVYSGIDYTSVKTKKRLLNEFLLTLPRNKKHNLPFSRKVICFDESLELDDIDLCRSRIAKLYEMGGRYSSGTESSNVFVYETQDSARYNYAKDSTKSGHKIKFMHVSEFLKQLGDVPSLTFDDGAILRAGNRRRRLNRERAAEKNRAAQKQSRAQKKATPASDKNPPAVDGSKQTFDNQSKKQSKSLPPRENKKRAQKAKEANSNRSKKIQSVVLKPTKEEIEALDKKFEKMPKGMADKMTGTGTGLDKKKTKKQTKIKATDKATISSPAKKKKQSTNHND